ncbi:formyltransferase family protein [Tardiphaga sp.]|uniref:formyltransferase family protein n=1 Tax=Tardiphaga sp. TaxID=1926292 RepID=UPI00352ADEA2
MTDKRVTICAVGLKGAVFIENLVARGLRPQLIISYEQPDDHAAGFERIRALAEENQSDFVNDKRPALLPNDLTFLVGWQFLVAAPGPFTIVFHDSLLPRYRGFAPTVTALINGEARIGVTALIPNAGIDEGDIVAQKGVAISYPMKIERALEIQAALMADLAVDIHSDWLAGRFSSREQDHRGATYCIWRDKQDHVIDWSWPAERILRFIHAVGYPYSGALTYLDRAELLVDDATMIDDLQFEDRHCGKIWQLDAGRPVVICGSGLLRLDAVRKDGEVYRFDRLRQRLG